MEKHKVKIPRRPRRRLQAFVRRHGAPQRRQVMPWGKYPGKLIAQLAFIEPAYFHWCWRDAGDPRVRDEIENLLQKLNTSLVQTSCSDCGDNLAVIAEVPLGHDGHDVKGARLVCESCDHWEGYRRYELSLAGLMHFCDAERRKCERQNFARLLARTYGITKITEKAVLDLFIPMRNSGTGGR